MKKHLLALIPIVVSLLVGCSSKGLSNNSNNNKKLELSVLCPTGAPSLAFYNYANDPNFETNSNASQGILPMMIGEKVDVAVLPTNAGINAIRKVNGAPYKIAATLTFGNFFIASTGNDEDRTLNDGDYIILFQQNQIPDLLFHYVYGTTLDSNIHYVAGATEASKCLKTGKNITSDNETVDYVLIAQPALQTILNSTPKVSKYASIQELYKEKTGGNGIFQASVFVKNSLNHDSVNRFLSQIETDVNEGIMNPSLIEDGLNKSDNIASQYGVPSGEIIKEIIEKDNGIGLGFQTAKANKKAIDQFLEVFKIGETNEEIYY